VRLPVCAGYLGQVDAAGGERLSGPAAIGRGLLDTGRPHVPGTADTRDYGRACGHCGSGYAGQPAADPSATVAMSDRNGIALCDTGQHPPDHQIRSLGAAGKLASFW
jgi:hypothetical protein